MAEHSKIADIVSFPRRSHDWTQQELGEFYRVENALTQAGLRVSCDRGLTDEGDPWYVFYRDTDHEPLVHFARIDGYYIIASAAYDGIAKGKNFREMILDLLEKHQLNKETISRKSNVFFHPAALLITLVGVAFFKAPPSAKADTPLDVHKSDELVNSKTKATLSYPANTEVRGQVTHPATIVWTEEMTSILLLAITELATINQSAAVELLDKPAHQNSEASLDTITPLSSLRTNDVGLQDPIIDVTQVAAPTEPTSIPAFDAMTQIDKLSNSLKFEAKLLFSLLNEVPISTEHGDISALTTIVKQSMPHTALLKSAPSFAHLVDNLSQNLVGGAGQDTSKSYSIASSSNDKQSKTTNLEQSKTSNETTHAEDTTTNTANNHTPTPSIVSTKFDIENKISLTSSSPSALAIIKQLDQSFHFTNEKAAYPENISNLNNISDQTQSPTFSSHTSLPQAQSSGDSVKNYSLTVIGDSIQAASNSNQDSLNTKSWNGGDIESLIGKFLQTFASVSFTSDSREAFVFQTTASQSSSQQLEQISINFQDGSNINIIGQKMEIDALMAHT